MADLICRWRNSTPEVVVEFVSKLPHESMPSKDFREYMVGIWPDFFRTAYQLACQLGLYYEDADGTYYPRFSENITLLEAWVYLRSWIYGYYVPNPYIAKDGFNNIDCPTFFFAELVKYSQEHPNCKFSDAYREILGEPANNNLDIIKNVINRFSGVLYFENDETLTITTDSSKLTRLFMDRADKQSFFHSFDTAKNELSLADYSNFSLSDKIDCFSTYLKQKGLDDKSIKQYTKHLIQELVSNEVEKQTGKENCIYNITDEVLLIYITTFFLTLSIKKEEIYFQPQSQITSHLFHLLQQILQ